MKKYIDIMLDLETMGNTPNSAIIAIGAVSFSIEKNEILNSFYRNIDLESSMKIGMTPDASTIKWWMKQSNEARAEINNKNAISIQNALSQFSRWLGSECPQDYQLRVWGNGAMFDNVIIKNAFRKCGYEVPWNFWNDMCYRTIKNLNKDIKIETHGTKHNASDDARSQAIHLMKMI